MRRKSASVVAMFAMLMAVMIPQAGAFAGDDGETDDDENSGSQDEDGAEDGEDAALQVQTLDSEPIETMTLEEHCPNHEGHPGKVGSNQSPTTVDIDGHEVLVTISGRSVAFSKDVEFCVKASNQATGKLNGTSYDTSVGPPKLHNRGGQHPNISHVVVYEVHQPVCDVTIGTDTSKLSYSWTGIDTVTVNIKDGKVPCDDVKLWLSSYDIPETWDGGAHNPSLFPQDHRDSEVFFFPKNEQPQEQTKTVELPDECVSAQIDLYWGPDKLGDPVLAYPGHGSTYISHRFQVAQECAEPETTRFWVKKVVTGEGTPSSSTRFDFSYDCGGDEVGGFTLEHDQSRFIEVEYVGDRPTCTISEDEDHGAAEVSNTRQDDDGHEAEFQLERNWTKNKVTFTNRFEQEPVVEIDASSICVAGLTTNDRGVITGGEMIFEVHGSGGYDGQEIAFNHRPAGAAAVQSGTVGSGGSTLASSEVGRFGVVYVRIDGGSIEDRITLKSHTDCTPSVTLEKEWDGLSDEQREAFGVTVTFEDQDENTYGPGDTIDLAPGASIELTEDVDGLPTGCTWVADEADDLSWTAPGLGDLEDYLELYGEDGEGFHHVLTANNTVICGDPSIRLEKSADETAFEVFEEDGDTSYEVTYTYVVTNDGELDLDGLTLIDDITTLGEQVDLTEDLTTALDATFGSTVLEVGESVAVQWTTSYDADEDPAQIDNIATVTGTDPFEALVTDSDDESISSTFVGGVTEEQPEVAPEVAPEVEPEVERVTVKREVETETEVLGVTLPRTGASVLVLLVTGLLALVAGGSALRHRRHEG